MMTGCLPLAWGGAARGVGKDDGGRLPCVRRWEGETSRSSSATTAAVAVVACVVGRRGAVLVFNVVAAVP